MQSSSHLKLLTLVLTVFVALNSSAAPQDEIPLDRTKKGENVTPADPKKMENLSISTPPPGDFNEERKFDPATYYHAYHRGLDVHLGFVWGFKDSSEEDQFTNYVLGVRYLLPNDSRNRWEVSAEFLTLGHAHATVSRRRIYRETSYLRPYYRYGVTHKFVTKDRLASFSNFDNYLATVAVGVEETRNPPKSLRLDVELSAGAEDILGLFTIGYSWGW